MIRGLLEREDAIVALATPPGASAVGVIRLSGRGVFSIVEQFCKTEDGSPFDPHAVAETKGEGSGPSLRWRVVYGTATLSLAGHSLPCPALFYIMPAPHSYTCEDGMEIHLPGSPPILDAALRACLAAGARLAGPGEFTLRAFLHGRLDLGQAEAVERIVTAHSESDRREAVQRLAGEIPRRIGHWREELRLLAAHVEAMLDFEEEELDEDLRTGLSEQLLRFAEECRSLAEKSAQPRTQSGGIPVWFVGRSRAGKSSLLNALLGYSAILVGDPIHSQPTTRDHLIHLLPLGRFLFELHDGPGIGVEDPLDQLAVSRHLALLDAASIICFVIDGSTPFLVDPLFERLRDRRVLPIVNKVDLPLQVDLGALQEWITSFAPQWGAILSTSATQHTGIQELKDRLRDEAIGAEGVMSGGCVTVREREDLRKAAEACERAAEYAARGEMLELLAEELRTAYLSLDPQGGVGYGEEILESIFARFCIGK